MVKPWFKKIQSRCKIFCFAHHGRLSLQDSGRERHYRSSIAHQPVGCQLQMSGIQIAYNLTAVLAEAHGWVRTGWSTQHFVGFERSRRQDGKVEDTKSEQNRHCRLCTHTRCPGKKKMCLKTIASSGKTEDHHPVVGCGGDRDVQPSARSAAAFGSSTNVPTQQYSRW